MGLFACPMQSISFDYVPLKTKCIALFSPNRKYAMVLDTSDTYKIKIYDFIQNFPNEQTYHHLLVQQKWSNGTLGCSYCGSISSTNSNLKTFSCRCNDCRKDFSILTHTIMENTHIPLQKWLLGIFLMSRDKRGVSALELARDLDISNEKARHMALTASRLGWRENRPICSMKRRNG